MMWRRPGLARAALLVHAALALRWAAFPVAVLWASGLLSVALQLAGWFCGWPLLVLLADAVAAAAFAAGARGLHVSRGYVVLAALGCLAHIALATLLLRGVPIVGAPLAALPACLCLFAGGCSYLCCRQRLWGVLYCGWALGETFAGLGLAHGLHFALSSLLSNEQGGVEDEWYWLWAIQEAIVVLSWLSFLVQLLVLGLLFSPSKAPPCVLDDAGRECNLDIQLVGAPRSAISHGDWAPLPTAAVLPPLERRGRVRLAAFGSLCLAVGCCLLCAALGWVHFALSAVGTPYTAGPQLPPCEGCYCIARPGHVNVQHNVRFGTAWSHKKGQLVPLLLDVYRREVPSPANESAAAPAVVFIHGGGFHKGDKSSCVLQLEATELAQRGFVAFNINYRLEAVPGLPPNAAVQDAVEDARAAVRFIVRHAAEYGVDRHRIALWGSSAGAITAASLSFAEHEGGAGSNAGYPSNVTAAIGLSGTIWPFLFSDSKHPGRPAPWFNIHGTSDLLVPFFLAKMTHLYLQALGVPQEANQLAVVPGGGHRPWRSSGSCADGDPCALLRPRVHAFLVGALGLEHAPCPA